MNITSTSDSTDSSCNHFRRDASCSDKPRHVKRLNFAPLNLEPDTVEQFSALNRGLLIDQNMARIPCISKSDYVRKWIETHENSRCDSSHELSQSSPVLRRSPTNTVNTSPIIGSSRKRRRRKTDINRRVAVKNADNANCRENADHSAKYSMQSEPDCEKEEERENKRACPSEIRCMSPCTEQVAGNESSPVLTRLFSRKKNWKRSLCILEDVASSKRLKSHEANISVNPTARSDDDLDTLREIPADCKRLGEDLNVTVKKAALFSIGTKKSPEKFDVAFSSPERLQEKLSLEDSSSSNVNKDNTNIEIETSDNEEIGNSNEKYNGTSSSQSSNSNLSDIIEDIDTQEVTKTSRFFIPNKSLIPSRRLFVSSQLATDNLNETYCSEAEIMSTHLSAKISQVPSSLKENTQKTNNKSTQSDAIISSITTPSKKSPDKTMHNCLLDSGKKRRKPKKGSMVAKLQSLITAQISGIRIWRYRMNKNPHDAASAEFISVLIRGCTKRFGNQFLDGILIEDRFNLLQSHIEVEEAEPNARGSNTEVSKARPREIPHRDIIIILVCDIVGTLKMTSKIVMNVYPPWNILDKNNLTIEANYVSINDNCEIPDIPNDSRKRKRRVIKEFNCPCIEEQRELPFCARKPNADKPDVIQRIFDF